MGRPTIIVHGGCGRIDQASIPARAEGVKAAAEAGWKVLEKGGSSVDAVEAAVMVLEDNPLFNAGTGSTLNSEGGVETDAAIMNGSDLAAGAVAAVTGILNPIHLARRVMEVSPHVLLVAGGAEAFARSEHIAECNPQQLITQSRWKQWEDAHGTVGATACDRNGRLAAATSTGGSFNKLPGRVGDTPLIGCGTYADSQVAVSCTGNGEHIMRVTLARLAAFLYGDLHDAQKAVDKSLERFESALGGEVGIILVGNSGRAAFGKNTPNMPVCSIGEDGLAVNC